MTILIIILCGLLCFGVIKYKSTFSPVGFLAFIWAFFILATLCFQSIIELKFIGVIFIIFAIFCSLLGYYVANKTNKPTDKFINILINRKLLLYSLVVITLLGFVNPIYHIYNHGLSLSNLFNFDEYLDMTTKLYLDRNTENITNVSFSYFMQLFLVFTYTAPILGGYFWLNTQNKKQKLLSILTIVPCLFVTLTQSTKMTTISSIILWIAGFMTNIFTNNIKLKLSIKFYISFVSVFVLFIVFLYFSMITRASDKITSEEIENNEYKFVNYAIGSIPCFDNWFFYKDTKKIDLSSIILHTSTNNAFKEQIESDSGVFINFDTILFKNLFEIHGINIIYYNYLPNQQYTMQITIKSDVQPQNVKTSLLSNLTHYFIDMTNVNQINDTTWRYWQTFTIPEERKQVRTPDFILNLNGSSYIEFSNFRVDTGTVALPWVDGDGNICFEPKNVKPKYYFGGMTFLGISNPLGLVKREIGIYQEYVNYSEKISSNGTNVYTAFRPLIEDFGKLGACIFMFLLGFLSSKAINFIQRRKYLALSQTILIAIYCYVMWSFVTSFWAYTSFLGAFGLTFIILHYVQKPKQNQNSVE